MVDRKRVFVQRDPQSVRLVRAVTASGGFPDAPPDEWFEDPELSKPTPLTITSDGRVYGHLAAWDSTHIGMPGKVRPPRSKSNYQFFRTGLLRTASGKDVSVGQLTLAGGHAPLSADASAAVKHYDDTASAIADLAAGEDQHGIWLAGALRSSVTPADLRAIRASAPSGDWRPINGHLELVAACQVNVPGFPLCRGLAASGSGEYLALVAAGAFDMALRRARELDSDLIERIEMLEATVASAERRSAKDELRRKVKSITSRTISD